MIELKLKQKDKSIYYYKFSAVGLYGVLIINRDTEEISFQEIDGFCKDDEKEKEIVLYRCLKAIKNYDFADRCMWASH